MTHEDHSEAVAANSDDDNCEIQKLWRSSITARVVLCPKMKAPTKMVMTPQTVKVPLQGIQTPANLQSNSQASFLLVSTSKQWIREALAGQVASWRHEARLTQ